jgi:deoxycytidine triphosphate deaminase
MYFLEPREMVWVLSKEEFRMPANVTGLATLRTTFTKQGILALNVGIIDPLFEGPISTALITFFGQAQARRRR